MTTGEAEADRRRGVLEVATAILLGLVSVATALGAYQASEWAQKAGLYEMTAVQLRDASLSTNIASQLNGFDDGERIFDALALEFDVINGLETDVAGIRSQQVAILEGGTPGLADEWLRWVGEGYPEDAFPMTSAEFLAPQYAPTYGANQASSVAFGLADELGDRSLLLTIAAAVFALSLLLLGVSGANQSLKVAFALALGGGGVFVVGVGLSLVAIVG